MRNIMLIAAAAAVLVASPAQADSLRDGFPICISENLLDQMYTAMMNQDMDGIEYLLGHGCSVTRKGVKASLLDRSNWGSRAHIRIYEGRDNAEAYVSIGALESWKP